ncbi:hypothetical protein ACVWXM_006296 [Bradyrhizobium sp. GM7.3]
MTKQFGHRDLRIARHEAAHLTVGRALGAKFGGATIEENRELGFSGLCWGPDFQSRCADEVCATTSVIEQISDLMPRDGDAREDDVASIHQHVHGRVIELTAGSEAENSCFGHAWEATDDRRQERELASLIYSSRQAQDLFIAACAAEARAILQRHAHVLEALTVALLKQRTLTGDQIDSTIRPHRRCPPACARTRAASPVAECRRPRQQL